MDEKVQQGIILGIQGALQFSGNQADEATVKQIYASIMQQISKSQRAPQAGVASAKQGGKIDYFVNKFGNGGYINAFQGGGTNATEELAPAVVTASKGHTSAAKDAKKDAKKQARADKKAANKEFRQTRRNLRSQYRDQKRTFDPSQPNVVINSPGDTTVTYPNIYSPTSSRRVYPDGSVIYSNTGRYEGSETYDPRYTIPGFFGRLFRRPASPQQQRDWDDALRNEYPSNNILDRTLIQ